MEKFLKFTSSFLLGALGGFGLLWLMLKIDLNEQTILGSIILIVAGTLFFGLAQLFIKKVIISKNDPYPGVYYAIFVTPFFLIFFGSLFLYF
ncbi:hypothetical protein [Phocicoccus pinnipedialis]|uniref:Uncharacterized protein n=1 Tax=Phocicoccus pinnipedialis TaxID=110845 RepID=A0A6V7R9Z8_9BACL|nr:hypothetical protein [Jeotgalicoccus pinnipedialis]MBP1940163.1 hypothetical protein [Jeotgalicoccus pinnipedialis]CAD2073804.1 hypothetical protein JEOPIN946_00744 [Jeotgalicoccus pinnipedialis]